MEDEDSGYQHSNNCADSLFCFLYSPNDDAKKITKNGTHYTISRSCSKMTLSCPMDPMEYLIVNVLRFCVFNKTVTLEEEWCSL
jgi:hypothetical protein